MRETDAPPDRDSADAPSRAMPLLIAAFLIAAIMRLPGLGARSLWLDEFCTWHVSQMGVWESLRWAPELTIPPLYQFLVRLLDHGSHPPEWLLRLPAAVAGILVVPASYWLGRVLASRRIGLALAVAMAFNALQIEYSREARPYSMLVLGCTLSFALWHQVLTRQRRRDVVLYIVVTALSFYAHLLTLLTVLAQVLWMAINHRTRTSRQSLRHPLVALLATAALIVPLVLRTVYFRASVTQAVDWIDPPTWDRVTGTLGDLTFGPLYMPTVAFLALAVIWWARMHPETHSGASDESAVPTAPAVEFALSIWLCCAWLGLLLLSWLVVPMTVTRYALPATVPALLLPLVLAARLHRHGPAVLAALIVCGTAPQWFVKCTSTEPGFREMVDYIRSHADPLTDGVALVIEPSKTPHWAEMRRLALQYYPLNEGNVQELHINARQEEADTQVLRDGRPWYLIAFRSDPVAVVRAAWRHCELFAVDGSLYQQLLFQPYRLLKVAPKIGVAAP